MKACHGLAPVFEDDNLVSAAGLVPALELTESAGLSASARAVCTLPAANLTGKVRTVMAGMLAGADGIDDLNVLPAGAPPGSFAVCGCRRRSARSRVRSAMVTCCKLHAANRRLLSGLVARVRGLVRAGDLVFVDVDDTIREVHGYAKQGAGFGYSGVRA